jgi:hypothetical protein
MWGEFFFLEAVAKVLGVRREDASASVPGRRG